ncbi:MAG TPA: hypothetical protein VGH20_11440 [Myxococcales bacterium]|jgi:hypothetical protein
MLTLEERSDIDAAALRRATAERVKALDKAGLFADGVDAEYVEQAQWMVYCAMRIDRILEKNDIARIVEDKLDRAELVHEILLHFTGGPVGFWNMWLSSQGLPPTTQDQPAQDWPPDLRATSRRVRSAHSAFAAATPAEAIGLWRALWVEISEFTDRAPAPRLMNRIG